MTKKHLRLEREQYTYWQGALCPTHPWMHNTAPKLAQKFYADQILDRPNYGGLAKMVYWFMQGAKGFAPLHPICLTVGSQGFKSSSTSRTLAAYLMRAQWPTLIRSRGDHQGMISNAQQLDQCPQQFATVHPLHKHPETWKQDLQHSRRLLDKMTINPTLKPLDLLRSIQAQVEHIKYLGRAN
jgi:hypothetical protein